jgi:integrase/recombinase XerD
MIPLRKAVDEYLAMRRPLGYKLNDMGYHLQHFVSFMRKQKASVITAKLALRWAVEPRDVLPAQWAKRLGFVRSFARYRSVFDPRTEIPPVGLLPYRAQRTTPYIYSRRDIQRLLQAATKLAPRGGPRPWTYYTVFGLLAVTGMRVGEVVRLECEDVDLSEALLTIRRTKFGKSRLVPLHASTVKMLIRYLRLREHLHPPPSATRLFLSNQRRPLTECMVRWTFVKICRQVGLRTIGDGSGPRLHDLRHRFAVTTLLDWYRSGVDVEQHLPVLSTFLGHVHVTDTYWYLSGVPELLALTKTRLEKRWEAFS